MEYMDLRMFEVMFHVCNMKRARGTKQHACYKMIYSAEYTIMHWRHWISNLEFNIIRTCSDRAYEWDIHAHMVQHTYHEMLMH